MTLRLPVCLVFAVVLAAGCAAFETENSNATRESRIVGGSPEDGYVAVGAIMNDTGLCTATIFDGPWVVTASHCFMDRRENFSFYMGPDVNAPIRVIPVAQIFTHPQFDSVNLTNDIAVLRLAEDPGVAGIPLVPALDNSVIGQELLFVGYGITSGGGDDAGIKRSMLIRLGYNRLDQA